MNRLKRTVLVVLALVASAAADESCKTMREMDADTRAAMEQAARQMFELSASGNTQGLQQAAIPALAQNFAGVQLTIEQNKELFAGGTANVRVSYLLEETGTQTAESAEFFCGIFNSPQRVQFTLPNLPPGRYGLVVQDVSNAKGKATLSLVLQDVGGQWKLAGYIPKKMEVGGNDGLYYWKQAREYKKTGQKMNSWLYYLTAYELIAPVNFLSNVTTEKLGTEMQEVLPPDAPNQQKPMAVQVDGKTFNVIDLNVVAVEGKLNLLVRYQSADVSNTAQAFADNKAVMKAILTKYPEFRAAFSGVVARAIEPSGRDYGTLLAMKDVL